MITNRDDVSIAIRSAFLRKGAQQKFSLIALIIISILLIYLDSLRSTPLNIIRSAVKDIIFRGSVVVSYPGKIFSSSFNAITHHFNLYEKNINLESENAALKESLYNKEFLTLQNQELKELLNQEMKSSSLLLNAKVIIDKNSPFLKSIIINKGANEKIKKGMAALDGKYFIGRVVEVNYFSSRVLLLSDLNSKIPVIIEPEGHQAILSGTGTNNPVLDFLPKNHEVKNENTVFTSGKDGIFRPGIPIGKTFIDEEKVSVILFSDFDQLSYINIDLAASSENEIE